MIAVSLEDARALYALECEKRGRRPGQDNERQLAAMRLEIALLKENHMRYTRRMATAFHGLTPMGDGCYVRGAHARVKRHREEF